MDFKTRHPHIKYWPEYTDETHCRPFPYDSPHKITISQLDAPDGSTKFLKYSAYSTEDYRYMVSYLIEAPPECPMRREFEFGELTWEEFWYHRGWLIEFRAELEGPAPIEVRYVSPEQLPTKVKDTLRRMGNTSPMSLKLAALELYCSFPFPPDVPMPAYDHVLEEFREKYPTIVSSTEMRRRKTA